MKTVSLIFLNSLLALLLFAEDGMKPLVFPELDGWSASQSAEPFSPETLYEYINGAADAYLACEFRALVVHTYRDAKGHTITVEAYRHRDLDHAFGIYSQEKPLSGPFLTVGAEGYSEEGIFNFYKGSWYFKLFDDDYIDADGSILKGLAVKIDHVIPGLPTQPATLDLFPGEGQVEFSEAFIAKNYLGYSFLQKAFISSYRVKNETLKVFVMKADDSAGASSMLASYTALAAEKKSEIEKIEGGVMFLDPNNISGGPVMLKVRGSYLIGGFSRNQPALSALLNKIEEKIDSLNGAG